LVTKGAEGWEAALEAYAEGARRGLFFLCGVRVRELKVKSSTFLLDAVTTIKRLILTRIGGELLPLTLTVTRIGGELLPLTLTVTRIGGELPAIKRQDITGGFEERGPPAMVLDLHGLHLDCGDLAVSYLLDEVISYYKPLF